MAMKITEAQLKKIIRESLDEIMDEENMDEDALGKTKGVLNGVGQVLKGGFNKIKRGILDTGLRKEYNGQTFRDRLKAANDQIKTAAKGGDKQRDLDRAAKTVQSLIDGKTFGGDKILNAPNTIQAAKTLLNAIKMAKMGSVGGVNSALAKRYGAPKQPQQPQAQRQVAESKLDKIIRESIKKHIG